MSGQKFTLSDVTSFLLDNLSVKAKKKLYLCMQLSFILRFNSFRMVKSHSYNVTTWILTQHKKTKFSIKNFFSKCDQIRSFLRMWLHLLKKSLMQSFIFSAMRAVFWKKADFLFWEKANYSLQLGGCLFQSGYFFKRRYLLQQLPFQKSYFLQHYF